MTPQEKEQFNEMRVQLQKLTEFMEEKKNRQIKAPLDVTSQQVLYENIPVVVRWVSAGAASNNGYVRVKINGKSFKLMTRA